MWVGGGGEQAGGATKHFRADLKPARLQLCVWCRFALHTSKCPHPPLQLVGVSEVKEGESPGRVAPACPAPTGGSAFPGAGSTSCRWALEGGWTRALSCFAVCPRQEWTSLLSGTEFPYNQTLCLEKGRSSRTSGATTRRESDAPCPSQRYVPAACSPWHTCAKGEKRRPVDPRRNASLLLPRLSRTAGNYAMKLEWEVPW